MSIQRRPYYWQPEEHFDFGIAGEHPVVFVAWIEDDGPEFKLNVNIVRAYAVIPNGGSLPSEWDFTSEIKKYPGRLERYEDEVRQDFLAKREKDWNGEIGA